MSKDYVEATRATLQVAHTSMDVAGRIKGTF